MMSYLACVSRFSVLAVALLSSSVVMASGLQVSPISLSLQARENASGLTLSNTGNNKIHAQVRVYHWTQDETGDKLTLSRGLLASPPMIALNPNQKQLIRIIRATAPPQGVGAVAASYRVVIDELPIKSPDEQSGLQFALSYSVPVFVNPTGVTKTQPNLQWHMYLQPDADTMQVKLRVSNTGNGHAQLANLSYVDTAGHSTDIYKGLVGYVLPGATMNWTLKIPPSTVATGGKFKVIVNGTQTLQDIALDNTPR